MRSATRTILQAGILILAGALTLGASGQPDGKDSAGAPDREGIPMGKDGAPMLLIPEGCFKMGTDNVGTEQFQGFPNESPEHTVCLKPYYIDQFEVTIALYAKFLEETKYDPPSLWDDEAVATAGDRPVVGVTWTAAEAYCKWAGKRLPTEAEWEKAARGTDGRRYPWGHMQPFVDIANYNRGQWVSYPITLAPVKSGIAGMSVRHGTKQGGRSPYGLYHMAGNAAEWVADWYERDYYSKSPKDNPTGPASGDRKVFRGGSWNDPPRNLRVTARFVAEPSYEDQTIGFRCAMDAPK